MKLADIKSNPNNPRLIRDDKFRKLVKSIEEFPKMMALRPMVINADNIVLGGNMRLKALKELGYKDIPDEWVKRAEDLTEEETRRFIIADNVGFGEHDWEMLANEWDVDELSEWGLDIPNFEVDTDYSDKNKEVDTDFLDQKYTFKLEYSEEEYLELKEKIAEIGKTPEAIFYDALISL
jgi:ParB-like chromosome segregation protein Spo0J